MANESKRWVIEITGDLGESVSSSSSSKKQSKKTPLNTLQRLIASPGQLIKSSLLDKEAESYEEGHKISGTMSAIGIQAASKLSSLALESAEFAFNRYASLQEDYMSQQTLANIEGSINRLSNAGNSIMSGAMSMAAFGPWGMIAGGLIGGASFGANQYLKYQKRMSSYYQQLNATNFQTEFSSSRLGLIGSSGTEN